MGEWYFILWNFDLKQAVIRETLDLLLRRDFCMKELSINTPNTPKHMQIYWCYWEKNIIYHYNVHIFISHSNDKCLLTDTSGVKTFSMSMNQSVLESTIRLSRRVNFIACRSSKKSSFFEVTKKVFNPSGRVAQVEYTTLLTCRYGLCSRAQGQ